MTHYEHYRCDFCGTTNWPNNKVTPFVFGLREPNKDTLIEEATGSVFEDADLHLCHNCHKTIKETEL